MSAIAAKKAERVLFPVGNYVDYEEHNHEDSILKMRNLQKILRNNACYFESNSVMCAVNDISSTPTFNEAVDRQNERFHCICGCR